MYLPAWTAIKYNTDYKGLFVRLVSKHGIKMKAGVAVQRKLLELVYVIYKNGTVFDPEYMLKKEDLAIQQKADKQNAQKNTTEVDVTEENDTIKQKTNIQDQQQRKIEIKENINAEKKIGNSLKKPLPIQADLCRLE